MKKYFPSLVLCALVCLVYGNTLLNSFHFDDINAILQKPWIRGLDKIPQFIFSFAQRPLLILTFNINYAISEFNVWSYHLLNIIGHFVVALLVYRLVVLIGEFGGDGRSNAPAPFLAALIFALHPLNTQSVTYLSSRSAVLVTLFYLSTMILLFRGFLDCAQWQKKLFFSGATVSLGCGFLSKEIIMSFPAMAFLFHFYFMSRRSFGGWLVQQLKWIVLAGSVLGAGILYKYLKHGTFLPTSPTDYSSATYFLTQTFVLPFQYFRKMFFPFNLSIDIHFPVYSDWLSISSYAGIAFLLAIVAGLVFVSRTRPLMGFGLAWALITVLPESSFVPLLDVAVEHRTYLPLAGYAIFAADGLCLVMRSLKTSPSGFFLSGSAVILILLCFAVGLIQRNRVWKDELSLWTDAAKKAPYLVRPHNNLAEAYDKLELYDKAIAGFESTLKIDPNYIFGLSNIGNIYGKKEEYWKAIEYFEKALAIKSDYAPAHYNLAKAFHKVGQPQKALEHYRSAVRYNPYFEEAYYNLAFLASETGLQDEAIKNFLVFLEGQPKHTRARFGLGNAYFQNKQLDLALDQYQKIIALDPSYIFPYINTATIYMQTGKHDEAIATYKKILAIRPGIAGVHKNLGMIYYQSKNDPRQALSYFEESIRLEPDQPEASIIQRAIVNIRNEAEVLPK
jgi:tetratricopeptide (TPR) repeat protein